MSKDPNDPMFFPRLRRHTTLAFILTGVIFLITFVVVAVAKAGALDGARKEKLPRDDVYYEITNDGNDHGNYVETYHVPNGRGGTVYCVVYSDKIGKGGGAGIDCDWAHAQ